MTFLNLLDREVSILCQGEAALADGCAYVVNSGSVLHDRVWSLLRCNARRLQVVLTAIIFVAAFGGGWLGGLDLYSLLYDVQEQSIEVLPFDSFVERIIFAESSDNPNMTNGRSSATGLGQFLSETWLDMIRAHRPDLADGRSQKEILDLRRDSKLAREITTRFVERNALMLRKRGLPVTAETVYLTHFAGSAGAIAILSAPEDANAALVMANADATGRTSREKIVKANPFLEHFTVADLKRWADRKMGSHGL